MKLTQLIPIFGLSLISLLGLIGHPVRAERAVSAETNSKPSFTFRIRDEPETLDWNRAHTVVEAYILMNIMEGLVTFDKNLKVVPALAEKWEVSADGRVYTFKIRSGVRWSDGVPLTAKDFVYSWKRLLSPVTAASYSDFLFDIEGAQAFNQRKIKDFNQVGIKALDDLTFQVKLTSPIIHWIDIPAFWVTFPVRQDIVEKYGEGWATPGRIVNLGPYSLEAHDIGSKVVMKANPNYYGTRGNVEQITALILKDDISALGMYEAGQLDFVADLGAIDQKKLLDRADLKVLPHLKTGFISFVVDKYPISNVKLRRAIAMSLDRAKLSKVLRGKQLPATSFVPPGMMGYSKSIGLPFNPAQAKYELAAMGYGTGNPLTVELVLPDWDKAEGVGEFIKTELKSLLGLNVVLQAVDNKAFRTQLMLHAYPIFYNTWTADYPDPDNFLSLFQSSSGNSETTWKNVKFDQLVEAGRLSRNEKEREGIYAQLQKILLEDEAVIIPLYYEPNLALVRPRVKNFDLNPLDYLYLRDLKIVL